MCSPARGRIVATALTFQASIWAAQALCLGEVPHAMQSGDAYRTASWSSSRHRHCAETAEIGTLTCTLVEIQAKPGAPEPGGQFRDGRCSFKPLEGPEEVYDAKVEGISLTPTDGAKTVMWVVKGLQGTPLEPGLLEQHYEADRGSREDSLPVRFGVSNPRLALHHMTDKPEGSASAPTKPRPIGFVILRVD